MTLSTGDFVGLANEAYDDNPSSPININGNSFELVYSSPSDPSGYVGYVLYDVADNSVVVIDRGTQGPEDWSIDAAMAATDSNLQWPAAKTLADWAQAYAQPRNATVYAVGHSLGGTLAQMQAAVYGWDGVTFNAYGSGEVLSGLGYTVSPNQPNITNYRALFDLVSESSTQIGNVVTLETSHDRDFLESSFEFDPLDLIETVGADHGLSNFWNGQNSDPARGKYVAASMFSFPEPSDVTEFLAQNMVMAFGKTLSTTREILADIYNTTSPPAIASDVLGWIVGKYQSGETVVIPADYALVTNALNPSTSYNIYRASLDAGSSVVLDGIDPSEVQSDTLWSPGQTSGLTKDYLIARGAMVQATLKMAAEDHLSGGTITTDDVGTYVYTDLKQSSSPLYKLVGTGPDTYSIEFGTDGNDVLSPTAGTLSEVFGGAGDDTLTDGAGNSTLEGGAGDDHYWIDGTQAGTDHILDTDGQGDITWELPGGSAPILTGGDAVPGGSIWKSADGSITYTELAQADGTTELEIRGGNKTVFVDDFTNGELGITLNAATPPTYGSSNLSLLRDGGVVGNTDIPDGADHIYTNDAGTGPVATIYGADSSGTYGNEINGEGNATYIYAGNGDNTVLLGDFSYKATAPLATPISAVLQGGSGNQGLIGVGNGTETITGGAVGSDTSASTYIDGGGATAVLVGGGQTSVIFGGTGADTLVASSADGSSPPGFNPASIEIAGLSFWGDVYSTQLDENNHSYQETALPTVSWVGTSADNAQINLSLYQSDGTFATPIGLLGSSLDSGTDDGATTLPGSLLIGGTGNDWLIGNAGDDTIIGGDPTDTVSGVADEILVGGAGTNLIYGGGGTEVIYADMVPDAVSDWAGLNPTDADTIYGGTGDEFIYGSGGNDVIYGGSGDYTINTGNGNAYVEAGSGNTLINGGTGNDTIIAGSGTDSITTGDGNSYVNVGGGQALITTGAGADTIEAAGGEAFITEGSGTTTILAGPGTGMDVVEAGSSSTTVQLQGGLTESALIARDVDVNGDLELSDEDSDTQIWVAGYFTGGSGNVAVQFADGTTWGASQILAASMAPRTDGGNDTLIGSDGNDSITAGYGDTAIVGVSGNNTLVGGAGDDTIQGGSGADTIKGGSGTTQILGGTGSETYVYNLGDGSDTIFENATVAGVDALQFGAGISPSDVAYSYDSTSNSLLIQFGTLSNATINVQGLVATQPNQHQIATFAFADGTTLTQLQVIQQAVSIDGTAGNDSLTGTPELDYFDGKGGNDVEIGNGGNDTFVFNAGYGQLSINESYTSGQQPVLQLGTGITASALQVTSDGTNLMLSDGVSGDQVTLDGMWSTPGDGVATVQLADGTTLTAAQLVQMEMTGTTGSDTLWGTTGADLIDGKGGNDYMVGDGGSDTFVFDSGYGDLEIRESYTSGQQPVLQLGAGITASALQVTSVGYALMLTDGVSGDQITLDNMLWTSGAGVAVVQLADGATLTASQLIQMEMIGTTGNDTIYGTSGADLLDGKGGNDYVDGGGGSDTFVFDSGYGDLEINESYASGEQPVLQLGAGITASALHVTSDGDALMLTDGVSGDQIMLDYMWWGEGNGVAVVQLADGTTLTPAQLMQMEMAGTTGSDTLWGTTGADLIDGKAGNDLVYGEGGSDTFVFDSGYGDLYINESYTSGQQPVLQLGAGITASALHVTAAYTGNGIDLVLTDGVSGDQIMLDYMWSNSGDGVAVVQLADGTTLTRSQLIQMELAGATSGNDTLWGTTGAELLDAKGGNDAVNGDGGSDTFVFDSGYGDLEIIESYNSGQQPELLLGTGITASALRVTSNGTNLLLADGVSGDQITLYNMSSNSSEGVAVVQLADGTMLTRSQLIQMGMTGTTGNDTIYGTPGDDLIDGKGGTDFVTGGGGNDTFVFNAGYGQLTILEDNSNGQIEQPGTFASGKSPVLELGSGITLSDLTVTRSSDLVITDGTNGDEIILEYEGEVGDYGVALVKLADGTTLTEQQLLQMADNITGTTGNDTLNTNGAGDVIDGKGGDDLINGFGGNDTIIFNAGYGQLEINEFGSPYGVTNAPKLSNHPLVQLGAGITESMLRVTTTPGYDQNPDVTGWPTAPRNIIVTDGISGDQITLDNMWDSGNTSLPVLQFSDGTSLTVSQLEQTEINSGTSGNDTLYGTLGFGTTGNDLIDGKGGNDQVFGSMFSGDGVTPYDEYGALLFGGYYDGSDTFVFNAGYGKLEITEEYNQDQPVLQLGSGITISSLHVTTDGGSLYLTDGVNGDQVSLYGMFGASTSERMFGVADVKLVDGTTLTAAQLIQMEMIGTTGNETIFGTSGADLIDGKGGNDSVIGNGGSDTFVFDSGYGQLTINESYMSGQQPVLQLGAGITTSALHASMSGNDLVLTDGVSGDQITLNSMWSNSGYDGVAVAQLADGTTLTAAQLIQLEMTGTTGNDTIYGTFGADLIDGKGGNDSVIGNGGSDTFVFDAGYGQLAINELFTSGQQPLLQLGAGITASMLKATTSGNNLVLTDGVSGDQITLLNMETSSTNGVASVTLADGTTLTAAQLVQMSHEFTGTTGNDTLTGTTGADLIDGKGGNDSLVGNGGSDTFVFNSGYGQLTINESYTSGQQPVLELGAGITASTLRVTKNGNDLELTDGVSGDQISLYDMWSSSSHGVAAAQLADGTVFTRSQLIQMEMTGTTGSDTIYGTSGADLLDGKGGGDSIVGSGGNDTFVFDSGYGQLTINESFKSGQQPVLELGAGITTATLHVTRNSNNLVLSDGTSGDQISLYDMWSSSTFGVATAQLADGTVLSRAQLIQMEMTGTTGNNTIYGTSGADLIDGKGGSDSVTGYGGNDTFVFDSGYGSLTINESYTSGQQPVLELGAGITASALRITSNGTQLYLTDGISGDKVTLINMWTSDVKGVATVQLADGTTLTASQLIQMEMTGTTGNDTIYGESSADLIDGKGGSDSVIGEGGNDTFVFDSGYGHLTINESFTSGQTPVLELGTGITASALRVTSNGTNLYLKDGVTGDEVILNTMWTSGTHGVATVQLADGTTFTASQLIRMEMTGTTGNDTIYGTSSADLIDGKGGSDSVIGEGGNDTFVFDSGYGHLTINESFTSGQTPVLELGTGITASTLHVATSGSNLLLTDGVSGDQIILDNMATSSANGVATVQLADGTTLTRSQLLQMEQMSATSLLTRSPATADLIPATALMSSWKPDLTPDMAPTGSRIPNLTPDNPVSPSQGVVIGAGNVRLPATTTSTISSTNGRLGGRPQNHGTSQAHARAGRSPIADAQSTAQSMAKEGAQPTSAGNDADQGTRAPSPVSVLDTRLASPLLLAQAQSESDVSVAPGAPVDPLLNDRDDPDAGVDLSHAAGAGDGVQQPFGTALGATFVPAYGQRQLANTASAADAMVKALAPRNGLRSLPTGSESASETQDEIRFQGNDVWSRSAVDRTLAALPSTGGAVSDLSSRLTDLAHAQLISAMASFRPSASAESTSTIPPSLDTYTLAAAVGMH